MGNRYFCINMKARLSLLAFAVVASFSLLAGCVQNSTQGPVSASTFASESPQPYITEELLPDVVQCVPAPPAFNSPEFEYDSIRYEWGKAQRANPERLAEAVRDAIWSLDTTLAIMSVPFGG